MEAKGHQDDCGTGHMKGFGDLVHGFRSVHDRRYNRNAKDLNGVAGGQDGDGAADKLYRQCRQQYQGYPVGQPLQQRCLGCEGGTDIGQAPDDTGPEDDIQGHGNGHMEHKQFDFPLLGGRLVRRYTDDEQGDHACRNDPVQGNGQPAVAGVGVFDTHHCSPFFMGLKRYRWSDHWRSLMAISEAKLKHWNHTSTLPNPMSLRRCR